MKRGSLVYLFKSFTETRCLNFAEHFMETKLSRHLELVVCFTEVVQFSWLQANVKIEEGNIYSPLTETVNIKIITTCKYLKVLHIAHLMSLGTTEIFVKIVNGMAGIWDVALYKAEQVS